MKLYNTLTRSVEPFTPLVPPTVTMYVCGPTVYDEPHIGHARSAYIFDVLRRYLEYRDKQENKHVQVKFVRNVTDVDDKIIQKAHETGESPEAVAERYLKSYHDTLERLGIGSPTEEPRATQHVVPEMTDLIAKLLMQGVAYEAGGDVYFAVRKFPGYGTLSNRTLDELQAGARVEPGEHKKDPLDFALWKAAKPGEPSWNSPWGKGRPGWHIECTAMSTKYLGDAFDIHGGGVDLVFPHHENEIAQAHAAGKPFARFWMHNGLLTVNGEKMSKSLGNYLTVEQVLADYPHSDYLKLFFLKTHYRSPIDYSRVRMDEARKNWQEFSRFFQLYHQKEKDLPKDQRFDFTGSKNIFEKAMDDDLSTPMALSLLFGLANSGLTMLESGDHHLLSGVEGTYKTLLTYGQVLGLFLQGLSEVEEETRKWLDVRIEERDKARKEKDYKKGDKIREEVRERGFLLADTANGTMWIRVQ